jgi:uncharacterized membrane protein (UPF0127 family)
LKLIIAGCILVVSIFILFSLSFKEQKKDSTQEIITYNLEGKNLKLLIADTDEEREKGLMFLREIKGADGMIFLFEDKTTRAFWNKNTLMDLDVYWIDENKIVGKSILPSIEKSKEIVVIQSPKPANKVIEIPRK